MFVQNPLLQPVLIVVEGQIPVLGGLLHESVSWIVLVCRIDEFIWRERSTALLALVAVSSLGTAARTCAHDVAVGEEFACHLVAELFFGLLYQFVLVVECAEEVAGKLVVDF